MKKIVVILIILVLSFSIAGCVNQEKVIEIGIENAIEVKANEDISAIKEEEMPVAIQDRQLIDSPDINFNNFLDNNPQIKIGKISKSTYIDDWAYGEKYRVETTKGTYIFFAYKKDVVSIYDRTFNNQRELIYNDEQLSKQATEEVGQLATNIKVEATDDFPEYEIIFQVKKLGSKKLMGDVLITSYNKNTPKETLNKTASQIANLHNFVDVSFYSTIEAYQYNINVEEGSVENFKKGYLGRMDDGEFIFSKY